MLKSRTALCIIWALAFALSIILIVLCSDQASTNIGVLLVFDALAFCSQFVLWFSLSRNVQDKDQVFYNMPLAIVSCSYLFVAAVFNIVCAFLKNAVTTKGSIIINLIIVIVAWIAIVALLGAKGHIARVDSRQKDDHVEL